MNEESGTRVDAHGSNDLTDNNTVGFATGKQGNAADFIKTNSETLTIADGSQSGLDLSGDFTICFWVMFDDATGGIFGKYRSSTNQRAYAAEMRNDPMTEIGIILDDNGTSPVQKNYSWTPTEGTWYFVTITYDASAGEVDVLIDTSSLTAQTGFPTSLHDSSEQFMIGGYNTVAGMEGKLEEFAIWSRILSGAELTELYNSGSGLSYADTASATFIPRILNIT